MDATVLFEKLKFPLGQPLSKHHHLPEMKKFFWRANIQNLMTKPDADGFAEDGLIKTGNLPQLPALSPTAHLS